MIICRGSFKCQSIVAQLSQPVRTYVHQSLGARLPQTSADSFRVSRCAVEGSKDLVPIRLSNPFFATVAKCTCLHEQAPSMLPGPLGGATSYLRWHCIVVRRADVQCLPYPSLVVFIYMCQRGEWSLVGTQRSFDCAVQSCITNRRVCS